MDKIIVYSVNINGYDDIITPKVYDPNVRYILLTDNKKAQSDVWEIYQVKTLNEIKDLRKRSRYFKINPHLVLPEHEISIYIDANLEPKFSDTSNLLNSLGFENHNMMSFKHPIRNCIFDEAEEVLKLKLDSNLIVSSQMKRYMSMGFPKNHGLFECGFMIRKNNTKVKNFNETWWKEVKNNSGRDQLSHMFACWYSDVYPGIITMGKSTDDTELLESKNNHKLTFRV